MAPRASWKGYLRLSLVNCPVRLYPATSSKDRISFNQLHKDTHNRINMKPVDPELGLVDRADLVKGYEYEDKKFVIIDDSDLESVKIESNHTVNIEAFVDQDAIERVRRARIAVAVQRFDRNGVRRVHEPAHVHAVVLVARVIRSRRRDDRFDATPAQLPRQRGDVLLRAADRAGPVAVSDVDDFHWGRTTCRSGTRTDLTRS